MPISRTQFNENNTILYKTRIIRTNVNRSSNFSADFIDINKNGVADSTYSRTGFSSHRDTYEEPAMSASMAKIKEQLETMDQGEVATQDDLQQMQVEDIQVNFSNWKLVSTTVDNSGFRNLATVIHEVAPLGTDKNVAIDTNTREFLVYTPTKQALNSPGA